MDTRRFLLSHLPWTLLLLIGPHVAKGFDVPWSTEYCQKQGIALHCSSMEYYNVHCDCVSCEPPVAHCSSNARDDHSCRKFAEMKFCGFDSTTASSSVVGSSSSASTTLASASQASGSEVTSLSDSRSVNYFVATNVTTEGAYSTALGIGIPLGIIFSAIALATVIIKRRGKQFETDLEKPWHRICCRRSTRRQSDGVGVGDNAEAETPLANPRATPTRQISSGSHSVQVTSEPINPDESGGLIELELADFTGEPSPPQVPDRDSTVGPLSPPLPLTLEDEASPQQRQQRRISKNRGEKADRSGNRNA